MDEVPDKHSDSAQRRSRPADQGPWSPRAVGALYAKGKETRSRKDWLAPDHQENQFPEDAHDNGRGRYDNDTKGWVRGQGPVEGGLHPCFDHGHFDINNVPQKPTGPANKATGRNIAASPFSAAHRKGAGEGF